MLRNFVVLRFIFIDRHKAESLSSPVASSSLFPYISSLSKAEVQDFLNRLWFLRRLTFDVPSLAHYVTYQYDSWFCLVANLFTRKIWQSGHQADTIFLATD
mmetsp:Transcript_20723/g.42696  ORF Transcript_20723/g.42696 Transcript_20723/m.42696 type:complete len:101 (-) Transcript_20723:64-366(-)